MSEGRKDSHTCVKIQKSMEIVNSGLEIGVQLGAIDVEWLDGTVVSHVEVGLRHS
jgi:hypothetical protein